MLCAALWATGSRWCPVIDAVMLLRGERRHCAEMAAYERWRALHAARDDLVDRLRAEGL